VTRLLLATRNAGKLRELEQLLGEAGLEGVVVETLAGHAEVGEVEETGETFDENAHLKATQVARATGLWTLAEDSGLEVEALGGAPGVLSARYAGRHGDNLANNERLLRELEGVTDRQARFVCVAALARPDGQIVATERGVCRGSIVEKPRGARGFGYDPCFLPEEKDLTMAELSPGEKGAISHRGRALRALIPALERLSGEQPTPGRRPS
jgi:XTP/dITP diphosphohydrolase